MAVKKAFLLVLPLLLACFVFPRCEADTVETWAVIVGGPCLYLRTQKDNYYLYYTLTRRFHVNNDHIMWLYFTGDAYEYEPDSIDDASTVEKIHYAISEWLPSHADSNDEVIIYITGHGYGYDYNHSQYVERCIDEDGDEGDEHGGFGIDEDIHVFGVYAGQEREYYSDDDLKADLSGWTCGSRTIIIGSCYGGGFIDDLSGMGTIITATGEVITAEIDRDGDGFSEFEEVLFDALFGYNTTFDEGTKTIVVHYDKPVDADIDSNGRVSWWEAFKYAWEHDDARILGLETPWFDDDGNGYPTFKNGENHLDYKLYIYIDNVYPYGGNTDPALGLHAYFYGDEVYVTAKEASGFTFKGWLLDRTVSSDNPIKVTMNADHTLKVYFSPKRSNPGGPDTCPTLLTWNGTGYVDYGVIHIHNHSGEDVIREVNIAKEDLAVENRKVKIRLREGWEGLNFSESEIDQVRLYATNEDGKLKLCPLLSAEHSSLGDVLEEIKASDDVKVQTLLLETIDLTFKVQEDVQGFTFMIEGCNTYKQ